MKLSGNDKFDDIYKKYRDDVLRIAFGITRDSYLAEDVFQETFMELYVKIETINCATAEKWLRKVARNKSLNLVSNVNAETKKVGYFGNDSEWIESKLEGNLFEKVEAYEDKKLSVEIFEKLYEENKRWHEAVTKVYCYGESPKEAAKEMGMRVNNMYVMLYRARTWIHRKFGERYDKMFPKYK